MMFRKITEYGLEEFPAILPFDRQLRNDWFSTPAGKKKHLGVGSAECNGNLTDARMRLLGKHIHGLVGAPVVRAGCRWGRAPSARTP